MKKLSDDHTLLMKKTCPYCAKVLMAAEDMGLQLQTRDITQDHDALQLLLEKGGKKQVPCLLHADAAMYESDAIIAYLQQQA